MKAIVYKKFGSPDVLELMEVEKPVPKDDEVLIRIYAATVTAEDPKLRSAAFPFLLWLPARLVIGFRKPRRPILGFELAGEIESIGRAVMQFKKGDQVYGYTGVSFGAYAEYKCMPEKGILAMKPVNMTYEEAAAVPNGALTALIFLRNKGHIQKGEKVLIYGASGAVGTAAVQLAKYFGAEVTGVCSTKNIEVVKALGADKVIDYTKEDFTQRGETYDIIFDTVGKSNLLLGKNVLNKNGRYLLTDVGLPAIIQIIWTSVIGSRKIIFAASNLSWKPGDLYFIKEVIEAGKLKSVVDRCYTLEQIKEAHRYVEKGHKRGNVAITIMSETEA